MAECALVCMSQSRLTEPLCRSRMDTLTQHLEAHVPVNSAGQLPADLLSAATGLPKQRIKLAMNRGAVWLTRGSKTQRLRRIKRALLKGDEVHLYYNAAVLAEVPPEPMLIEDVGAYSVWNKPCGLLSQGSKWGDHCTVVRWAEQHLKPQRVAFTVHRLDRATSGLILVAHSRTVAAALSGLFSERKITKRYRATVAGDFSQQPNPLRVDQAMDDRNAVSEFTFLGYRPDNDSSLVDVRIETGRKHQIRRHLASLGHPVVGDRLYGTGRTGGADLQLTAYLLAFQCPVNDRYVEYRLPGFS